MKYGPAALDWSVLVSIESEQDNLYLPDLCGMEYHGLDLGCLSREVVPLGSSALPFFCDLISLRSSGYIFSL